MYDLGSGSNVDIMIIRKQGYELRRKIKEVGKKETIVNLPFKTLRNNIQVLKTQKITFGEEKKKETGMEIEE